MNTHALEVTGMSCDECARHVERALRGVPDVNSADVAYQQGTAHVTATSMLKADTLPGAVAAAGYRATRPEAARAAGPQPDRPLAAA